MLSAYSSSVPGRRPRTVNREEYEKADELFVRLHNEGLGFGSGWSPDVTGKASP